MTPTSKTKFNPREAQALIERQQKEIYALKNEIYCLQNDNEACRRDAAKTFHEFIQMKSFLSQKYKPLLREYRKLQSIHFQNTCTLKNTSKIFKMQAHEFSTENKKLQEKVKEQELVIETLTGPDGKSYIDYCTQKAAQKKEIREKKAQIREAKLVDLVYALERRRKSRSRSHSL